MFPNFFYMRGARWSFHTTKTLRRFFDCRRGGSERSELDLGPILPALSMVDGVWIPTLASLGRDENEKRRYTETAGLAVR